MDIAGHEIPLHLAVSAVILVVIAALIGTAPDVGRPTTQGNTTDLGTLLDGTDPVLGDRSAELVVFYWGDYQCPFCGQFERTTFPELRSSYISSGDMLYVKKNYPNVAGARSDYAALAAGCVQRLANASTYWSWHSGMYERDHFSAIQNERADIRGTVIQETSDLTGLGTANLSRCMDEHHEAIMTEVQKDVNEARQRGITSTPGFILFNRASNRSAYIYGAQPFNFFQQTIEELRGRQ